MTTQSLKKQSKSKALFAGTWYNQHDSEINLLVDENGIVSGTFKTSAEMSGKVEEFPLIGFVANDAISFSVSFAKYGSVTSWSGHFTDIAEDNNVDTLHTMWLMAVSLGNQADKNLWKSVLSGADNFVRGKGLKSDLSSWSSPSYPIWKQDQSSAY